MNLVLVILALSVSAMATVFRPQPINEQIQASHGVFQGHYLRSKAIELENGKVVTQMIFKMTHEQGLQSELFGMDEIIIHYPGGNLGDKNMKVEGVPDFIAGEKVILFVRGYENRYWGLNLGMGSFRVIKYGKETMLVNYLFPDHPQVGQVSMEIFEKTLKQLKGSRFKTVQMTQYPTIKPENVNRAPASEVTGQNRSIASDSYESENTHTSYSISMLWLLGILSVLGGTFRLSRQKIHK